MQARWSDIHLRFDNHRLFSGMSLSVASGEKVLLHGPSGSGKSTLLRLLLGFVQPDSGEVQIDGQPLNAQTVWNLRQKTGFVSQDVQIGSGSAYRFLQDLLDYRSNQHLSYTESDFLQHFKSFRLPEQALHQDVSRLSGGERQRLAIIAVLLLQRPLYLLDEPVSALDPELRQMVIQRFREMDSATVIAVDHQGDWEGFRKVDIQKL